MTAFSTGILGREIKTHRILEFGMRPRRHRAEWTKEPLTALSNSLNLGVTTLELDTHLTEDGRVIVWDDDAFQANKCLGTPDATAGDPEFPMGATAWPSCPWRRSRRPIAASFS